MPTPPKNSRRKLSEREAIAALRETLENEPRLPSADQLLERFREIKTAMPADVIPFSVDGDLAMAARNGGTISKATRIRMAELVRQIKKDKDRNGQ
jgi:hypothetical protein